MELQPGAAGFQLSNPPMLETISLLASLNVSIVVTIVSYNSSLCVKNFHDIV